jgi:type I restriction enzyme, S subunit
VKKKLKSQPPAPLKSAAPQLPKGWCWTRWSDVGVSQNGKAFPSNQYQEHGIRLLRPGNLHASGAVRWETHNTRHMPEGWASDEPAHLVGGDELVMNLTAQSLKDEFLGRVCLTASNERCLLNQRIARLTPTLVDRRYLLWLFKSPLFRRFVGSLNTGSLIQHIFTSQLDSFEIPLAPLREQQCIVDAIESYFARLDDAVTTLERVARNLKRYRASVLKAAVEGRLVPTEAALAKQEGRDYEPASILLERILSERRRLWSESGRKGKYQEPAPPDSTNLPDLPEGWCWTTIDSLIWDADYGTSQKCTYEATGPAVLRIPNVQGQSIRLDDLKFATDPDQLDVEGSLRVGDLIFIRTNGSRNLIGRGAVVLDELPGPHYFASYLIRLRLLPVSGLARWGGFVWHTPFLREQILGEAASSAGQYNVSLKAATRFVVPLAPAAEQVRILYEVERADSLAEATTATVSAAVGRSNRLRQSILKWAFGGKLADQDPHDEPASVLLDRIKAEQESAKPAKAARSQRGATKKQVRA